MARNGVLPRMFARTHPVHKTPHVAIIAQTALGIVVAILMGWKWGPLNAFGIISYALTSLVILVYITVCIATIVYFRTGRASAFNPWLHLVFPALGALAFLPPLFYQFHPLPGYPLRYGNWAAIILFSASLLVTIWVAATRPEKLDGNLLFIADSAPESAAPAAPVMTTPA
jgi:amino acid transporter